MKTETISVANAAQVLRPPEDELPYVRHDRAAEMRSAPGGLTIEGSSIISMSVSPNAGLRLDASGCAVMPGLVDCHTHLPFAGWRDTEYAQRIAGVSYEEISRMGGGIRASARAFRAASDAAVLEQTLAAASEMLRHGTTTFECKTGYGLSIEAETRAAALIAELDARTIQTITGTGLLAHVVPHGYDGGSWLTAVAEGLPKLLAAGALINALDIYVESVAFSNDDLRRMGALARSHRLALRAHVEQFNANGSVSVAVESGARSVDHLACMGDADVGLLANVETAAVLLPGAEFLAAERLPPARSLADAGAICVLASDFNPGTSPVLSLPLVIGLAVRRYRWTVLEALLACTQNAAWVLGLDGQLGSLEVGKRADVVLLDGPIELIPYRFGHNPVQAVIAGGELVYVRPGSESRITR